MKYLLALIFSFFCIAGFAQLADSVRIADSVARQEAILQKQQKLQDSMQHLQDSVQQLKDSMYTLSQQQFYRQLDTLIYAQNPYVPVKDPKWLISEKRVWTGKENIFYAIVAMLLFFAAARNSFHRYLSEIFRLFFRTTLRQRQIREQLIHAPLPSLLFNLLFLLSGSMYVNLLLHYFHLKTGLSFWLLLLYGIVALAVIYAVKFVSLKIFGWLLNIKPATDTYIFIVFSANKVLGVLLLPFIVFLAFTGGLLYETFFSLSILVVLGLYTYRFYLSYVSIYKIIQINIFHFLIYLAAFEIVPLLVINKVLVGFFLETR